MESQTEVLLTVPELIKKLRISKSTLLRLERNGLGPVCVLIGRRRLYRLADVDNFIVNSRFNSVVEE